MNPTLKKKKTDMVLGFYATAIPNPQKVELQPIDESSGYKILVIQGEQKNTKKVYALRSS